MEEDFEFVSYETTPKNAKKYFKTLCDVFSLKEGILHNKHSIFYKQQLLTLVPSDVCKFFCLKMYGNPMPDANSNPTLGRSTSLESYKKMISYFMPNRLIGWNVDTKQGNPTRSVSVNELIKKVKKAEVRKLGKASCARRPLDVDEFKWIVKLLREESNAMKRYGFAAIMCVQFHFAPRIDDTCQIMVDEIRLHSSCDSALRTRLCWCKNVMDERAAPHQIMFGANNFSFCPILSLAMFLELYYPTEENDNGKLNCFGALSRTATSIKNRVSDHLNTKIFKTDKFKLASRDGVSENVGTHSIRKMAATHARRNGCSRDDINIRGRWKRNNQMVDVYLDPEILYPEFSSSKEDWVKLDDIKTTVDEK